MPNYSKDKYTIKNPEKYIGNGQPTYRSSWELAAMRTFDENPAILKWASESVKIPYLNPFKQQYSVYVPDFLIIYMDAQGKQHTELIEIKPAKQTFKEHARTHINDKIQYALNQCKWEAARAWAKSKGIGFRIITENDLFHTGSRKRR